MGNCLSGCQGKTLVIQEVNRCNHKGNDRLKLTKKKSFFFFFNKKQTFLVGKIIIFQYS